MDPNIDYKFSLFICGATQHSTTAVRNIKQLCEEFLQGRYSLEIIDIYQQPALAEKEQIIAAPTLIKISPQPVKRLIGDMSDRRAVLSALDISR